MHIALDAPCIAVAFPTFAKDSGRIFVSLERGHASDVLTPELTENRRIETSRHRRDMQFNAAHDRLYVVCGDDESFDLAKLKVIDGCPTSPEFFVFSPDEKQICVSNEEDSTLEIIDVSANIVTARVPVSTVLDGVINGVDGKSAFVTSEVAEMVHGVDIASARVAQNIIGGTRPRRFIVTLDGSELWVTDDGALVIISLGCANPIAFVDTKSHKVRTYPLVGGRAWDGDLARDETVAFVANGLSDDFTVVGVATMQAVQSATVCCTPNSIRVDD
jgi:YVTN family beta-propeller protein